MGEWIRHRGSKKQPYFLDGKKFQVRTRNGCIVDINLGGSDGWWEHEKAPYDIMAYRIIEDDQALPHESHAHTFGIDGDTLPEHIENEEEKVHIDMVNEPPHYKQGDVECIDAIRAALTDEEWRGYCKGNALKYIWRERHKGGDESLQKADWYLNRLSK